MKVKTISIEELFKKYLIGRYYVDKDKRYKIVDVKSIEPWHWEEEHSIDEGIVINCKMKTEKGKTIYKSIEIEDMVEEFSF